MHFQTKYLNAVFSYWNNAFGLFCTLYFFMLVKKKKIKEKYHFLDPANPKCTPFIWDCH